jgi:mannose-1-phosphate guanylyltransferase
MKTYTALSPASETTVYNPARLAVSQRYHIPACAVNFEPDPRPVASLLPMHRWGIVLAGGEGVRLREFTQSMWGLDRPKQFCPLLGNGTLLEQTRERTERSISPEQILYSVTQAHERFYGPSLGRRASTRVVQPSNRGTAPAILSSLVQISRMDPNAVVVILPCDHYYFPESGFTTALDSAFKIAEEHPRSVLIMGIDAKRPEVEYGWIEVGARAGDSDGAHRVIGFCEKPPLAVAKKLLRQGALWNTFVMVGHVCSFLEMAWARAPRLLQAVESPEITWTSVNEVRIPDSVYERIAPADFSREILVPSAKRLLALRLRNVEWADIGKPDRLLQAILHTRKSSTVEERPMAALKAFGAAN